MKRGFSVEDCWPRISQRVAGSGSVLLLVTVHIICQSNHIPLSAVLVTLDAKMLLNFWNGKKCFLKLLDKIDHNLAFRISVTGLLKDPEAVMA